MVHSEGEQKSSDASADRSKGIGLKVLAAQTLKIASINGLGRLDKLEHDLEEELRLDNRSPAKTQFGRFRRKGEHYLHHSKVGLLVVVLLNIVDTLLVMIGLILDFHHTSSKLKSQNEMLDSFEQQFKHKYSIESEKILELVLNSTVILQAGHDPRPLARDCLQYLSMLASDSSQNLSSYLDTLGKTSFSGYQSTCFKRDNQSYHLASDGEVDETLSTVAHKLHYCSLSILSLLVIILILKLICFGHRFLKEKIMIFDGLVTVISLVLDVVFMDGITHFDEDQVVIVLSLLFPWRVIRILNSLIAAVLDHHKLNLKILYTQKKKISRSLTETQSMMEVMQRQIEVLQSLCSSRGIRDMDVSRAMTGDSTGGSTKNGGSNIGLAGMMALGKLAFQAADTMAPVNNSKNKPRNSSSSPAISSSDSSPFSSPTRPNTEPPSPGEMKNNNLRNPHDTVYEEHDTVGLDHPVSPGREPSLSPDIPPGTPRDSDTITITMNGSGPPKDSLSNHKMDVSFQLAEEGSTKQGGGDETVSRL